MTKCRPHLWMVVARWLFRTRCGRALVIAGLESWRRTPILRGVQKRRGRPVAAALNRQITEAREVA